MTDQETLKRFKPERPIYLHESNTGLKTKDEVLFAIQRLRDHPIQPWLCTYNENIRPLHMSFNNEKEFQEFKKHCKELSIPLKSPVLKDEEFSISDDISLVPEEPKSDYEGTDGRVRILK